MGFVEFLAAVAILVPICLAFLAWIQSGCPIDHSFPPPDPARQRPFVLDKILEALGGTAHVSFASLALADQVLCCPSSWNDLSRRLGCPLPALVSIGWERWDFPPDCREIGDLARIASAYHPDWQPAATCTVADWRQTRIFLGVRDVLVDALSVNEDEVTREARLMQELGAW